MKLFAEALTMTMLICGLTRSNQSSITSADFDKINVGEHVYCLSKESIFDYQYAKNNCIQINAQLAFFDSNEEFFLVSRELDSRQREYWIDFNYTINSSVSWKYNFSWRNEIFNDSVWAVGQPDGNCRNSSLSLQCCARKDPNKGLKDMNCTHSKYAFVCKAVPQCPLHADGCILSCGEQIIRFKCLDGFYFNDSTKSCEDKNECVQNSSHCNQSCTNTMGSYSCGCYSGYTLGSDNFTCGDINECLTNNGSCQQNCQNIEGSFRCECKDGYTLGSDNRTCDDVNECSLGIHKCQHNCSNTNGSYACSCEKGYLPSSDGYNCTQVETCLTSQCEHNCSNTSTGYICNCYPGYNLEADGISCSDINECDLSTCTNCSNTNNSNSCPAFCNVSSNVCDQVCNNFNGSFQCSCNPGYYLDITDNKTCRDIDECSLNSSLCEVFCINTPGSYFCSCPQGYQLSGNSYSCEKNTLTNFCPCSCLNTKIKDKMNKEQLTVYLETLTKSLQVSKGDLLSHRLTLTTQEDDRPTSYILGYFGIGTLTFVFGTIILPEVLMMTVVLIHKIRNLF